MIFFKHGFAYLISSYMMVNIFHWYSNQRTNLFRLVFFFSIRLRENEISVVIYQPAQQKFVGLQDVLKTSYEDVLKKSWRRFQDLSHVLEDQKLLRWRRLQDMSWRRLQDVQSQIKFLLVISVSNKSKCVSDKSLFYKLYLRNLRRIQSASLRTQ